MTGSSGSWRTCGGSMWWTRRLRTGVVLLGLALAPGPAAALASDRAQPIEIESDRAERDDARGISTYQGNVVYLQGTIRLEADEVRIFENQDRRVRRVEAEGVPVKFRQRIEGYDEDMRAEARHMTYVFDPEMLTLREAAHVWRLDTEVSAEQIRYDPVQDRVDARRSEAGDRRVRITIQPSGSPDALPGPPGD